jgi:hypothetical protein
MSRPLHATPISGASGSTSIRIAAFLAIAVLTVWAVIHLLALRYERGDVYPPGSTLRADPLGTKILAESLAGLPGVSMERNYRSLTRLKPVAPVVLAHLAIDFRIEISDAELAALESLVTSGTRAVFTFSPEFMRANPQRLKSGTPAPTTPPPTTAPLPPGVLPPSATPPPSPPSFRLHPAEDVTSFRDLGNKWGFAFDLVQEEKHVAFAGKAEPREPSSDLESEVQWHSALYFKGLAPAWRTLMTCNSVPVVIERNYGAGSIVLCSDTFFLTNEGMRDARSPRLIARIFGPPRPIIFDEAHFGVVENPGVATLARRLRLEGFVIALFVIAALFVWKNSSHFLPPLDAEDTQYVAGLDSDEGFITLLRRAVSPAQILAVCADEWRKSRGRRIRPEENAHVESVLRAHGSRSARDAIAAYRAITEGLRRR